jgi:hypothetical protein
MTALQKTGLVAGGYLGVFLLAAAAVAARVMTSGPESEAESGMRAFGDAIFFAWVFGLCALVPTGLALYFLRPYRPFWDFLAGGALVLALTAAGAAALYLLGRHDASFGLWLHFAILRLIAAPVWICAYAVSALISPFPKARAVLLAAAALEGAALASAVVVLVTL